MFATRGVKHVSDRHPDHSDPAEDDGDQVVEDLQALIEGLAQLLENLRPASGYYLRTALDAHRHSIGGKVVIDLPRRKGDPVNVTYIGGKLRLVVEG